MTRKKTPWLGIGIAVFLSWFGIGKILQVTKEYSAHQQAIADVEVIIQENTNLDSISTLDTLKDNQTKIQQSIKRLELIPSLPGYPYQNARNQISYLNQILSQINSKVKIEEEAAVNFQVALQLDSEATTIVRDKPYSYKWLEAKNKWQQAVILLDKIPTGTYVSDRVKSDVLTVKRNFDDVSKVVASEDKALENLSLAVELAQKAAILTKDSTSITLPDLLNAKSQWQQAISLLGNISTETQLFLEAQSQLSSYRDNYRLVSNGINEITKCTIQKTISESECTASVILDISPPENLTALLENIKEEDTNTNQIASSEFDSNSEIASDTSYDSIGSSYGSDYTKRSGSVYVRGYTRSDGTSVRGYTRSAPGSRVSGFGSFRSGGASS